MSFKKDDTVGLSSLFHLNSEPFVDESRVAQTSFLQKAKSYPFAPRTDLPAQEPTHTDDLATTRTSTRAFSDNAMSLAQVSSLLQSAYRAVDADLKAASQRFLRRPVPSAGGLYPLEIYALVRNVTGLDQGVYHYDPIGHGLEAVRPGPWQQMAQQAFLSWAYVEPAPVILCLGADFGRTQGKYGPRGYRYILFEAGHVAQNICLSASEQKLSSLCLGGFHDHVLNRLIGLDGEAEAILYAVAVGREK